MTSTLLQLQRAGYGTDRELQHLRPSQILRRLSATKQERANERAAFILDLRAAQGLEKEALRDYIDRLETDTP